jgi:hypothetical protein
MQTPAVAIAARKHATTAWRVSLLVDGVGMSDQSLWRSIKCLVDERAGGLVLSFSSA